MRGAGARLELDDVRRAVGGELRSGRGTEEAVGGERVAEACPADVVEATSEVEGEGAHGAVATRTLHPHLLRVEGRGGSGGGAYEDDEGLDRLRVEHLPELLGGAQVGDVVIGRPLLLRTAGDGAFTVGAVAELHAAKVEVEHCTPVFHPPRAEDEPEVRGDGLEHRDLPKDLAEAVREVDGEQRHKRDDALAVGWDAVKAGHVACGASVASGGEAAAGHLGVRDRGMKLAARVDEHRGVPHRRRVERR